MSLTIEIKTWRNTVHKERELYNLVQGEPRNPLANCLRSLYAEFVGTLDYFDRRLVSSPEAINTHHATIIGLIESLKKSKLT